jgi:hypothetical protein
VRFHLGALRREVFLMDMSSLAEPMATVLFFAFIWAFGFFALIWVFGAVCIKTADYIQLSQVDADGGPVPQNQPPSALQ